MYSCAHKCSLLAMDALATNFGVYYHLRGVCACVATHEIVYVCVHVCMYVLSVFYM